MLLDKALKKAKRTDEEKVGLNIKVPVGLKNDFDDVCKDHGVSMTSMMLALIETVVEESKGYYEILDAETLLELNNSILKLEKEIQDLCEVVDNAKDGKEAFVPSAYMDNDVLGMSLYDSKVAELKRLKMIFDQLQGEEK